MMIDHDVNTFHMDNVYDQHILFHFKIIYMQFVTYFHFCN
jgi:hypothetical protein